MARCEIHCPGGGDGAVVAVVAAVMVVVAVVALANVLANVLLWVLVILAVACAAGVVVLVAVLRAGRPAVAKAPARRAVEARTAPLAIEAPVPVLDGIVVRDETRERRWTT